MASAYVVHGAGYLGEMPVTCSQPVRFLLVAGNPLREAIAWRGPIVMNTREELQLAFEEYRRGTFLKHGHEQQVSRKRTNTT